MYGSETRVQARQLKYDDDDRDNVDDDNDESNDDDDDDDDDNNNNNNNNNNLLHFTSYLRKIFCVTLYKSSVVFSYITCYGVQYSYKYKKSSSLTQLAMLIPRTEVMNKNIYHGVQQAPSICF